MCWVEYLYLGRIKLPVAGAACMIMNPTKGRLTFNWILAYCNERQVLEIPLSKYCNGIGKSVLYLTPATLCFG
jgi:hypothetical protein